MLGVDWDSKIITVPQSDLTLITGTRYQLTVDQWFLLVREANASVGGIVNTVNFPIYKNTSPTTTTPRILDIINGYTVQFEDGSYSIEFIDGNTNLREVEIKNQVSVGTNNTSALINPAVLEAGVYAGQVVIDVINGFSGVGKTSDGKLLGTFAAPSNNETDALAIAVSENVRNMLFLSSMELNGDFSLGYTLCGVSPFVMLTINPVANMAGVATLNLTIEGELDGLNTVRDCSLLDVTNTGGFFENCAFRGSVTQNSALNMFNCFSQIEGGGSPEFDVGIYPTVARGHKGSILIKNAQDGHVSSIGVTEGRVTIDATCAGGEIHLRGQPLEVIDSSGAGCTVLVELDATPQTDVANIANLARDVLLSTESQAATPVGGIRSSLPSAV